MHEKERLSIESQDVTSLCLGTPLKQERDREWNVGVFAREDEERIWVP